MSTWVTCTYDLILLQWHYMASRFHVITSLPEWLKNICCYLIKWNLQNNLLSRVTIFFSYCFWVYNFLNILKQTRIIFWSPRKWAVPWLLPLLLQIRIYLTKNIDKMAYQMSQFLGEKHLCALSHILSSIRLIVEESWVYLEKFEKAVSYCHDTCTEMKNKYKINFTKSEFLFSSFTQIFSIFLKIYLTIFSTCFSKISEDFFSFTHIFSQISITYLKYTSNTY